MFLERMSRLKCTVFYLKGGAKYRDIKENKSTVL